MSSVIVLSRMVRDRAKSTLWWTVAMVVLAVAVGASYPAVRESAGGLEELMNSLPEGFGEMLGAAGGIASPAGYLNSQFYANIFPILLMVFGVGLAAWTIAGAEREGTLEPLLANPLRRSRLALGRYVGVVLLMIVPVIASTALFVVFRDSFELDDVAVDNLVAGSAGAFLLALLFASLTFAVGAATGRRGVAVAVGGGLGAATYVLFGLAAFVDLFKKIQWLSPWHWFLDPSPLTDGWTWASIFLPLVVTLPVVVFGTLWFTRRDLR